MLMIQRFDVARDAWVDEMTRHAYWSAYKTIRARSRITGRDYRIISAHSRSVLHTVIAADHACCCPINSPTPPSRAHYGLQPGS